MSLVVYPQRPQERRPDFIDPRFPSAYHPARPPKSGPDRIVIGVLAGAVFFYLLGKAIGLGRNPIEG